MTEKYYFTVKELMEILKTFPPDLPVLTSGYESGFENFFQPSVVTVKHMPENMYYDGEFQIAADGEPDTIEAVILQRVVRDD